MTHQSNDVELFIVNSAGIIFQQLLYFLCLGKASNQKDGHIAASYRSRDMCHV